MTAFRAVFLALLVLFACPAGAQKAAEKPALDQPNMDDAALLDWLQKTVTSTLTFSYAVAVPHMQQASAKFTEDGWDGFMKEMERSRMLESAITLQQKLSAEAHGTPLLLEQGASNGSYRWIVQVPLHLTYTSGKESRTDSVKVNLIAERVAVTRNNPSGIAIAKWMMQAGGTRN